jgi:hypothetical protein
MHDAITDLGHCAAVCELEAHLCPWDRVELNQRAEAYRSEQLRLLARLPQPVDLKNTTASAQLRGFAVFLAGIQKPLVVDEETGRRSRASQTASFGAAAGDSRKI